MIPNIYRLWRERGSAGWYLVDQLATRVLPPWRLPNGDAIEVLGHVSLAIAHDHSERPEDMARLQEVWRNLVMHLRKSPLTHGAGR